MRVKITEEEISSALDLAGDHPMYGSMKDRMKRGSKPSELFQALALRPPLISALAAVSDATYPSGLLERMLQERVILEISRANECQYCIGSHTATMKSLGVESPIESLDDAASLPERDKLALEYTRAAMRDSNRIPDELFTRLQKQFTDQEIVELTFLIGFMQTLNLFNNALRVTFHPDISQK